MSEYLVNRTFDELQIGDAASLSRTLKPVDIQLFAVVSGDINPAHVDPEYAKTDIFHKIVAHGMWGGSLLSTILGTELPGPGTIYLSQNLKFLKPVAVGDEITASVVVTAKKPEKNIVEMHCSCVNQHGQEVISGEASVIAPNEKVKIKKTDLPNVVFEKQQGAWYQKLIDLTKGFAPLITAVVHPVDEPSLRGAVAAAEGKLITPILVGPENKIRDLAKELKLDISGYELIPVEHSNQAAEVAVQMARQGRVEALMKGKLHTDELMEAVINKERGLRTGHRMSHVFAMEVPYYGKPLFITDAALNIAPMLADKQDIVQNAINLFTVIEAKVPKVAIIAAVETVDEKMLASMHAAALCKMAERGQITGGILDGPLSLDLAISNQSVAIKGIKSAVAGDADILVLPDIEAGNVLYKQMTYLAKVEAAGMVLGARVPIILTSRGSDELSRKASCALALLYTRREEKTLQ